MTTTEDMPFVEVPASPVVPYPYGLLSVAPTATPSDGHWSSGAWWRTDGCGAIGITYGKCNVESPVDLLANVGCDTTYAKSFTVYARSALSMAGATLAEKNAQARAALLAGEQFAAEATLWADMIAATPEANVTAGKAIDGFAIAEAQLAARYNGTGVLHVGRYGATLAHELLFTSGGRLATKLGTTVVAGGGYDVLPDSQGDVFKVFATGALTVMRSEVFDVGEHFDRNTNSVSAVVERTYVIGYDCTLVEVTVTPT